MSKARVAGVFYVLVFVTGSLALLRGPVASAAMPIAAALYVVVTVLLYQLFKPVNPVVSLAAACVSLAGIVIGPLRLLPVNPLVFFGFYCLFIAYLSGTSTFVPRVVAVLMMFAGVGWLTFASSSLAHRLFPFNFLPGVIGEASLTCWLLFTRVGADSARTVAA